ncbi:MAG: polysaccharide deacetylase family protein, partial [Chitinophagaceae bacterium]
PGIYQQILEDGHRTGNHTYSHPNGWKTDTPLYLEDIKKARDLIDSSLFRPPYGRITKRQAKGLEAALQKKEVTVVMWDVLSADFDLSFSPEDCAHIVLRAVSPGSIVVFHDSEKAKRNLQIALPHVLETLSRRGYRFKSL